MMQLGLSLEATSCLHVFQRNNINFLQQLSISTFFSGGVFFCCRQYNFFNFIIEKFKTISVLSSESLQKISLLSSESVKQISLLSSESSFWVPLLSSKSSHYFGFIIARIKAESTVSHSIYIKDGYSRSITCVFLVDVP